MATVSPATFKSTLHEMTQTTPTVLWNDSATLSELTYTIEHGGVGATCNPVIVLEALKSEAEIWNAKIKELAEQNPKATEDEIGWLLIEAISATRAKLLEPVFREHKGRNGRLSIQTDPHLYKDSGRLVDQAAALQRAGAKYDRQDPGNGRRHRGHRRGNLSWREHQRHSLLHLAAVRRGRGSGGAWLNAARKGRQGHLEDGSGLHHHGGPAGRLAKGDCREASDHDRRAGLSGVGGRRCLQENLPAL